MKPLRFADGNAGCVFSEVKSFWEEDVREFVLKNARKHLERMLQVEFRQEVGRRRFKRSQKRKDQHKGYYSRGLITLYRWLEETRHPVYGKVAGNRKY